MYRDFSEVSGASSVVTRDTEFGFFSKDTVNIFFPERQIKIRK